MTDGRIMRLLAALTTAAAVVAGSLVPAVAGAAHLGVDDAADAEPTVSGRPSAPDVSRLDIDYDPAGTITLRVGFSGALDTATLDTSQNYAFYANFKVGHAKQGYQAYGFNGYSCDTGTPGDLSGQHHVFNVYGSAFYDQASVTGYDGQLKFSRTVADDKKSVMIIAAGAVIAGRDYDCATYTIRGRRRGPAEHLNTRYDEACDCWYFSAQHDIVGAPRASNDHEPPVYFDGRIPPPLPQCADGIDNDGDGAIDTGNPGSGGNAYSPRDPGCPYAVTPGATESPACDDKIDNDGDGKIDTADDGCTDGSGTSEGRPPTACENGRDDDGDGKTDKRDPGCQGSAGGVSEADPPAVKSRVKLTAKSARCAVRTTVTLGPTLSPIKLFPLGKIRVTVTRGKSRVARTLRGQATVRRTFRLTKPGRYTVTARYLGDGFRLKSKTVKRMVVVARSACLKPRN